MLPEDFARQNEFGKQAEELVAVQFMRDGWTVNWKYFGKRRDLCVQHPKYGGETIEVKNEDRFSNGNNVCIELHQNGGRESGLLTSEATIYVHTLGDMCIVYRTQPMRNWLAKRLASGILQEQKFGKADNGNTGVIVPRLMLAMQAFAEWTDIARLTSSKVFALAEPQDPERWDGQS